MTSQAKTKTFDFLEYGKTIEEMMRTWSTHTQETLKQSSDLGLAREHFVKTVLASFLPKSIVVGSGEIIDGDGNSSGQQDVIIYRADFPVITSLTPVNTYLAEGVIATIEVKSNLSTGTPNGLDTAFRSAAKVGTLGKDLIYLGEVDHLDEVDHPIYSLLGECTTIRTYIVGYSGWKKDKSLLEKYGALGQEFPRKIVMKLGCKTFTRLIPWFPDVLYQPGYLVIRNDDSLINDPSSPASEYPLLLHQEYPFSMFLLHLLKAILAGTGGLTVRHPQIDAVAEYDLRPYFDLTQQPFAPLALGKASNHWA